MGSPEYALFMLNQEDSVATYYANFTAVANRVEGMPPRIMLACFISGLKKDLQRDMISLRPESISRAANLAKLYEDKYFPAPKTNTKRIAFTPILLLLRWEISRTR